MLRRSVYILRNNIRALATEASTSEAAAEPGVKSKIKGILQQAENPLTASEIWTQAEQQSVKSKRHMKQMLQQMRKDGQVKTIPLVAGKKKTQFGYRLKQGLPPKSQAASSEAKTEL